MKVVLCLVITCLGILQIQEVKACTDNQYKRSLPNGSTVCIDCPRCPPGLGQLVECGTTISTNTKIQCEICKAGVNFSAANNYEQCESCSVCSEDQVSKPCTPSSDTICEKRCMSKEKYYEESSHDCQVCTSCCGDGNDVVKSECLEKGMPREKSCTVHRKKLCKPPPTTVKKASTALPILAVITRTIQPTVDAKKTTEDNNYLIEPTKRKPSNQSHYQHSNINNSSSVNSSPTVTVQVLIGVCSLLGSVVIVGALVWLLRKCGICTSFSGSQRKFRIFYTKVPAGDKNNIVATYKDFRVFDLFKANHELKEDVCNKLDSCKSFAKLARHCGVSEDLVRKLEDNPGNEPTCDVFKAIEGIKPGFCFGEFASILEKIKRVDVLDHCVKKLKPFKEINV